jgi:hypothetical protein
LKKKRDFWASRRGEGAVLAGRRRKDTFGTHDYIIITSPLALRVEINVCGKPQREGRRVGE